MRSDVTDIDSDSINEAELMWRSASEVVKESNADAKVNVRAATREAWILRFGRKGKLAMPEALVRSGGNTSRTSKRARLELHDELHAEDDGADVDGDDDDEDDNSDDSDSDDSDDDDDGDDKGAGAARHDAPIPISNLDYERYKLLERQLKAQNERLEDLAQKMISSQQKMSQQILDLKEQVRTLVQSSSGPQFAADENDGTSGRGVAGAQNNTIVVSDRARRQGGAAGAHVSTDMEGVGALLSQLKNKYAAVLSELHSKDKEIEDLEDQLQPHLDFHRQLMGMNTNIKRS